MKFLLFFSVIVLIAKIAICEKSVEEQWFLFKSDFLKIYDTPQEESYRYNIFKENLLKIQKHNRKYESGKSTYFQGITSFADKSFVEYLRLMFGENDENFRHRGLLNESDTSRTIHDRKSYKLNTTYALDWTEKGAVTEVKDQGKCGSCYAFAAIGALESAHWKKNGKLVRLSEQNIVDCSTGYGNEGCDGGWPLGVFAYIEKNNGVATEESYPYEGVDKKCRFKPEQLGAKILSFSELKKGDENLINALENFGPTTVILDAGFLSFQLYAGGVLYEPQCVEDETTNHVVLVVGYGEQNGVKFWKIKNSLGVGWGDKGYFLLARDRNFHCGVGVSSSVVIADTLSESTNIFNQKFINFNLLLFTSFNIINFFG